MNIKLFVVAVKDVVNKRTSTYFETLNEAENDYDYFVQNGNGQLEIKLGKAEFEIIYDIDFFEKPKNQFLEAKCVKVKWIENYP
jgi:uncharacterized protein YqgQ